MSGVRAIPDPGFAGDEGDVPAEVAAALATYAQDPTTYWAALAALQDARVLVPVVAVLGEAEHDSTGLAREKTSDMATVLMRGRDGRTALLAFTGSAPLQRWNPQARPVPVSLRQAAEAARHEGAAALLLDVAGPVDLVVEGDDLTSLADGDRLTRVGNGWAWTREL